MATIEPRLMHLLNDPKANQFPPPDLPPLQVLSFSKSSARSLPPLEPDAGQGSDKSIPKAQRASQQQIPSLYSLTDEAPSRPYAPRNDGDYIKDRPRQSSGHPLRMLLDDPDVNESTHSLRLILDDTSEITDDPSNKKRHRALTVKEDFVQLPQPLKKQKSSQNVVPPIINGLHDPPANAAVFPPISSGSFDDNEKINLNPLKDYNVVEDRIASNSSTPVEADKAAAAKIKRRAAKPRRKWSEEETNHLLLGVSRHGVGKWTNILEDPDFKFNDRTAGDLKDRFRTCCPDEFRGTASGSKAPLQNKIASHASEAKSKLKAKTVLLLENILAEPEEPLEREKTQSSQPDSDSAPKQRKSRAHRKKIEDLENLGIRGPFKKSHRRERRPFTEQDDKEILEGLDQYGPAWTKIQRDPRFNLSSRQPTDLRDRVRNKYPDIYTRIEKGSFQVKEPGRNNLLEPSVITTMETTSFHSSKSGPLEPHLNRTSSKEDMPKWPVSSNLLDSAESLPGSQSFNMNETSGSAFIGSVGDMDISRLLLDDSQISTDN